MKSTLDAYKNLDFVTIEFKNAFKENIMGNEGFISKTNKGRMKRK